MFLAEFCMISVGLIFLFQIDQLVCEIGLTESYYCIWHLCSHKWHVAKIQ